MKKILCIILGLVSFKCYSQISILFSPRILSEVNSNYGRFRTDTMYTGNTKEVGVFIWPYQKVEIDISVNTLGHKVLIKDTAGKILYAQVKSMGKYVYSTKASKEVLVVYDLVNNKNYAIANFGRSDNLHAIIGFGSGDVNLRVKATLLPIKLDTANQHFVRFLKLGPVLIDEVHFSVSLSKLSPVNIRTEPEIDPNNGEFNLITDTNTYLKLKDFIYTNQKYLQRDTIGLNYPDKIGDYKIIIDATNVFYLKWDKTNQFLRELSAYLEQKDADYKVIKEMKTYLLF